MAGQGSSDDGLEGLAIMWPALFAHPGNAPPMPPLRLSVDAYSGLIGEMGEGLDEVAAALAAGSVPYGVVAGAGSPIPWGQAARTTAELSSRAFLTVVPAAGH